MLPQPNQPLFQVPFGRRRARHEDPAGLPLAARGSTPFLKAHCGMIPKGPVLFLGRGSVGDAVQMARRGRPVTIYDERPVRLAEYGVAAADADVGLKLHHGPVDDWRLGFQRWAGIVVLAGQWPAPQRRRLFAQIPNALKPGGVFLMETEVAAPIEADGLDDHRLDPEDIRPELEVLFLPRFVTLSPPSATGARIWAASLLQVVGIHLEPNGQDDPL